MIVPNTGRSLPHFVEVAEPSSGYDYHNQAWVVEGRYIACGHGKPCDCFGTLHAGELVKANADVH